MSAYDRPETLHDMLNRWEMEKMERRDDETRARNAGLGVDPAWIAARERVGRVAWIAIDEDETMGDDER